MEHRNDPWKTLSGPQRAAMEFLRDHLPESDWENAPFSLFLAFADHALMLREAAPWCAALSEEIFFHYVLCPRVNDEDLSLHRELFFDELWARVKDLGLEPAVLEVNRWCHEKASYQSQDDRTASPLTVYRNGSGRCGEESAFLVAALRSVGIPARQVYAPRWSHCDDNHAWAEALCGEAWRFLGACEPEPVLDRGWFNTAASRAVLIHSRTFGLGTSPLHGTLISCQDGVALYDQTARYADAREAVFRVTLNGASAPGASVTLHVLNEAHFWPIARLTTDGTGEARIVLGKGDLWVSAALGGLYTERLCPMDESDYTLELTVPQAGGWTEFDFRAPQAAPAPTALTAEQKTVRKAVLERGNSLRQARMAAWYQGDDPILSAARGNIAEISAFLGRDKNPLRRRLLAALSLKDLRDTAAETLEKALETAAPFEGNDSREIFDHYVLCPRVAFEGLDQCVKPGDVRAVLELRSQGVPARLRSLDGAVERWEDGAFHTVQAEEGGVLRLAKSGPAPVYRQGWSLARRGAEGWQLLNPELCWQGDLCELALPVGEYRLTTSVRLPSGDQFAAKREFEMRAGETVSEPLTMRSFDLGDLLYRRALPAVPAEGTTNALGLLHGPTLLFWLEEGGEPTEHVLNELAAAGELPSIAFFLRGRAALSQATLANLLRRRPQIQVFFDDWAYDLESLSRLLGTDPERPPLAIALNGAGEAVYAVSGYHVGSVELLGRIARHLKS